MIFFGPQLSSGPWGGELERGVLLLQPGLFFVLLVNLFLFVFFVGKLTGGPHVDSANFQLSRTAMRLSVILPGLSSLECTPLRLFECILTVPLCLYQCHRTRTSLLSAFSSGHGRSPQKSLSTLLVPCHVTMWQAWIWTEKQCVQLCLWRLRKCRICVKPVWKWDGAAASLSTFSSFTCVMCQNKKASE